MSKEDDNDEGKRSYLGEASNELRLEAFAVQHSCIKLSTKLNHLQEGACDITAQRSLCSVTQDMLLVSLGSEGNQRQKLGMAKRQKEFHGLENK